jgi:hypothetical protein
MKCEIINGRLYVKAGTVTEQWALDQYFDSMSSYMNPNTYIADASKAEAPEVKAALASTTDEVL